MSAAEEETWPWSSGSLSSSWEMRSECEWKCAIKAPFPLERGLFSATRPHTPGWRSQLYPQHLDARGARQTPSGGVRLQKAVVVSILTKPWLWNQEPWSDPDSSGGHRKSSELS